MMIGKISTEAACDGAIIRVFKMIIVVNQINVIVEEIWMVMAEWKEVSLVDAGRISSIDSMVILMMIQ